MKGTSALPKSPLDRFIGMKWDKACKWLDKNTHMLVLFGDANKPDERALSVVKTYKDVGLKGAMAALCAHLYVKRHGAGNAAVMAVTIYRRVYEEILWHGNRSKGALRRRAQEGLNELHNLEGMLAFGSIYISGSPRQWPLQPSFKKKSERAGLANILMALALRELVDQGTASQVAAMGIQRFLEKGFKGRVEKLKED